MKEKMQFLDGTMLKLIAMVAMVFDHVGDNFFPDQVWMRVIGRIAMPIFAFCIAEGFSHTRDQKKYLLRMVVFALVSEIPFDLVTAGKVLEFSHQNIMFTFSWAILGLLLYEKLTRRAEKVRNDQKQVTQGQARERQMMVKTGFIQGFVILLAFIALSIFLGLDYNFLAVSLIFIFYLLRDKALSLRNLAGMAIHVLLRNMGIYWFGLLGFLPLFFYSGKKGKGLKWLFYTFYPGHLFLIYLLREFLLRAQA